MSARRPARLERTTAARPGRRRGRPTRRDRALSHEQLVGKTCQYLCDGLTPAKIKEALKAEGITVSRELPYQLVALAAERRRLHYLAPLETRLAEELLRRFRGLHDLRVADTVVGDQVARRGAEWLLAHVKGQFAQREVHIGLSFGQTMRQLARHFAELLWTASGPLPRRIVFHAVVAGFDPYDPSTNPNTFFTYFMYDTVTPVPTAFVGLFAPPMVGARAFDEMHDDPLIRVAFDEAEKIDILVTSARAWSDPHAVLVRALQKENDGFISKLRAAGSVGDLIGQPLGPRGPVRPLDEAKAASLVSLEQVADFVAHGKRVLLVAGPCTECGQPKTEIVRIILDQPQRLVTDVVLDSCTARELLAPPGTAPPLGPAR